MSRLSYALILARRELRAGFGGFRIFLACLMLGVAAIAGIGSIAASVSAGIRGDARQLLGGDAAVEIAYRPATAAERRFLAQSGDVSEVAAMRAMARTVNGRRHSLIELKAVDAAYPLYGRMALSPAQGLAAALAPQHGVFGAAVDGTLADRLHLRRGDSFKVGEAVLQLRATIEREPDRALAGLVLGPRVMISQAALAATRLVQPGALVNYDYRLRLRAGVSPQAWVKQAHAAFPDAGWRVRSYADASPRVQTLIDRAALFLGLVGLTALLVGGVGIGNAVAGFVASKTQTIATLKCLGAPSRLVFAAYFVQVVALALAGIAAALVIGALLPVAVAPLLSGLLPVSLRFGIYPAPLAVAALFGLLTTLAFAIWPLAAVGQVPPAALFRDRATPAKHPLSRSAIGATAAAALCLAGLAIATAEDPGVALWYVGGAAVAFALFSAAGRGVMWLAQRVGRIPWVVARPVWRLAIANLHRPGAPTARIVLSLGLGLTVLVAVALTEANLATEIDTRMAQDAPALFFIDIQPDQLAGFADSVRQFPGARFEEVPMMRGRITRLNGVSVSKARVAPNARWAVGSDRGLTYAARVPPGSRIVAGRWWPVDYHGPPLVSFDAGLARGMGLAIGDTITVNLLGREITARIANLRAIDWTRLGINFVLVFAPGTLEAAPQTHLAAVYMPQSEADALVQRVTDRFPNVSAIPVREALAAVAQMVAAVGQAVRLTALVSLAAGALVLGGAIAAGHRRRVYEAVVLKVLGASRRTIAASFLIEHGLLGAASAVVAGALGAAAAYALVTGPMRMEWVFPPGPLLWTLLLASLVTLALGFAGTWRALGATAAPFLRNE